MTYTGHANALVELIEKKINSNVQIYNTYAHNIKIQSKFNPEPIPENLKKNLRLLKSLVEELKARVRLLKTAPKFRLPYEANLFAVQEKDDIKSFSDRMCGGNAQSTL